MKLVNGSKIGLVLFGFVFVSLGDISLATTASFQGLGDLPGSGTYSYANAISGDGRITVGGSHGPSGRAFVWRDGAMEVLAALPWPRRTTRRL